MSFVLLLHAGFVASAQTPFTLRYHAEQRGGLVFASNSVLGCSNYNATNEIPPAGNSDNNSFISQYIDVDDSGETFSSSSADVNLPECSSITFAGLYWGGIVSTSNPRYAQRNRVKLKQPGFANYIDLEADKSWGGQHFKDITEVIKRQTSAKGTYTLANVVGDEALKDRYAGWTLVICYRHNGEPLRNLSVFDGLLYVQANTKANFSIDGFMTPPSGPVNIDFGFVAYDGDRGHSGDYLSVNNQEAFDAVHQADNLFNSSITNKGVVVTSRNPAYSNTLGYDASIIHLDNTHYRYLSNSSGKASISVGSKSETYVIGVLTASIDIYNPAFQFTHQYRNLTNTGDVVKPGEQIEVQYNIKNVGNDRSANTIFSDTIPTLLEYESGSLEVQYGKGNWTRVSDDSGDDTGEFSENDRKFLIRLGDGANIFSGGAMEPGTTVKLRYRARLTDDCDKVRCSSGAVSKYGWLQFYGNVNSNMHWKILSDPLGASEECCTRGPLVIPIEACKLPTDTTIVIYCEASVADFHLPRGYSLFEGSDMQFKTAIDKVSEAGTYKARRLLSTGCEYAFNVNVLTASTSITTQPLSVEKKQGEEVTFFVEAKGAGVTYQWQTDQGKGSWVNIEGAVTPSLLIFNVSSSVNHYNYRASVYDRCGKQLISNSAELSVAAPASIPAPGTIDETHSTESSLYVPNAFMPSSTVEELKCFRAKGCGLVKWNMKIFNKWNQLIWETNSLDANGCPAEGWDGKMYGADAPQGVYLWSVSAYFANGKEWKGMSLNSSRPKRNGMLHLLR